LPTIGKVYDKILATRVSYHLEVRGLLSDNQFGFRKGRETTEAIDRAVGNLKRARAESKHAVLVALDIKNAFNSAWYPGLVQLLARMAVQEIWGGPSRTFCRITASLPKG
jgi:hypothetical protein